MFLSLSRQYSLLVFIAVMGLLQGAAAHNNLSGLGFFRYRPASYAFSVLAVGFSLFVFLTTHDTRPASSKVSSRSAFSRWPVTSHTLDTLRRKSLA